MTDLMTTWPPPAVFCAGLLIVLGLLTALACTYALIVSGTSRDHEEQEE